MMRSLFLDVQLPFATKRETYESEDVLLWFLGVCVRLNIYHLRAHPELPRLYASGVTYCAPDQMLGPKVRKDKIRDAASYLKSIGADDETAAIMVRFLSGDIEIFQDIMTLYRLGQGDCDRLVVARCAELMVAGFLARPYLLSFENPSGGTTYHAVVAHADDTIEDPSLILGMEGWDSPRREAEIRKNYARKDRMVATALDLMDGGASPEVLGSMIDDAGFVPVGGFPRRGAAVGSRAVPLRPRAAAIGSVPSSSMLRRAA